MASNLSTIGFHFAGEQQFRDTMLSCAAEVGDQIECPAGQYGIWRSRSGAEIWFHLGRTQAGEIEIVGLTPFFEGKSEVTLGLRRALHGSDENPFEGALEGVLNPQDNCEGGSYPIVFDAVDFALSGAQQLPVKQRVRLSAFAREMAAFPDEAAYFAAQEDTDRPVFASQSFIPVGLFASEQNGEAPEDMSAVAVPPSTAFFTGRVLEHNRLTNEATGRDFNWMLVETLDTVIDVLADPDIVTGEIAEGGIVQVSAVLFGRILG